MRTAAEVRTQQRLWGRDRVWAAVGLARKNSHLLSTLRYQFNCCELH